MHVCAHHNNVHELAINMCTSKTHQNQNDVHEYYIGRVVITMFPWGIVVNNEFGIFNFFL